MGLAFASFRVLPMRTRILARTVAHEIHARSGSIPPFDQHKRTAIHGQFLPVYG